MHLRSFFAISLALLTAACGVDQTSRSTGGPGVAGPEAGSPPGGGVDAGTPAPNGSGQVGTSGGPGQNGTTVVTPGNSVACEAHVVEGARATPDMLIVLDRSRSMNPDGNDDDTDRWGGSRTALIDLTAEFDEQVRFGLMTFPGAQRNGGDDDDDEDECAPGALNVPIGLNAGPAISAALMPMDADGRTPTAAALRAALPVVGDVQMGPDQVAVAKYVLLVTDGDPNCGSDNGGRGGGGGGGGGRDDAARMETIAAIEALTAAGVKTYVVGYQTAGSDFVDQLDRMAAAGGTGATQHSSVASAADLHATISALTSKLVSCSYQLNNAVADPSKVLVQVAQKPRNLNAAQDGWRLEGDGRTITLTGAACDEVRSGAIFSVQVTCESVPLF